MQRAAVYHQAAGVQSRGVVCGGHRRIGYRKQGALVRRVVYQAIEQRGRDFRVIAHEGQIVMDLREAEEIFPRFGAFGVNDIQGNVRVAG